MRVEAIDEVVGQFRPSQDFALIAFRTSMPRGSAQVPPSHDIGECVVVDILVVLVWSDDVADVR